MVHAVDWLIPTWVSYPGVHHPLSLYSEVHHLLSLEASTPHTKTCFSHARQVVCPDTSDDLKDAWLDVTLFDLIAVRVLD